MNQIQNDSMNNPNPLMVNPVKKSMNKYFFALIMFLTIALATGLIYFLVLDKDNNDNDSNNSSNEQREDDRQSTNSNEDNDEESSEINETDIDSDTSDELDDIQNDELVNTYYSVTETFEITDLSLNTGVVLQFSVVSPVNVTLTKSKAFIFNPDEAIVDSNGKAYLEYVIDTFEYKDSDKPFKIVLSELVPDSNGNETSIEVATMELR